MRLINHLRLFLGLPIKINLTQEQKYDLLKRLQQNNSPGALIEVTEDELSWMTTKDFQKLRSEL